MYGVDLGVAVQTSTKVWLLDTVERRHGAAIPAQDLGVKLGRRAFRRLAWRVGLGGKLSSRFAVRRVKVAHDDGIDARLGRHVVTHPLVTRNEAPASASTPLANALSPNDSKKPALDIDAPTGVAATG